MKRPVFLTSGVLAGLFCGVMIILSWGALFLQLKTDRERILRSAFLHTDNLARTFEEHSLRTVENVRQVLFSLKEIYEKRGGGGVRSFEEAANASVARYAIRSREAQGNLFNLLSIADENGDLVLSSQVPFNPVNIAARPFFRAHRDGEKGFLVGAPILGTATGKWYIPMSLPIEKTDGSFGGVVLASVNPFYFSGFYRQVSLGPQGTVLLVGSEGTILAGTVEGGETPFGASIVNSGLFTAMKADRAGILECGGLPDGILRLISYRKVFPYPLHVVAGREKDGVFSEYRRRRGGAFATLLVFDLFVLLFFFVSRRAQRKERQAEERFRNFFEQNSVGFALVSADGAWIHFNGRLCEMLGYSREELMNLPWKDLTPPDVLERELPLFEKALWSGTSDFFIEKQYERKDGARIDVDVTTKIMKNADGSVRYFASIVQDVSERKKGERLLENRAAELERHREAIIDSMAVLAEYRDKGTGNHVRRTKQYVKLLLERSGAAALFPEKDLPMIWQSAVLHDIGKVGVPDAVLLKPGGLSPEEFGVIRKHPSIGSDVLLRAEELLGTDSFINYARQITEYHHERWNGTGYPHGLAGEDIPILARITAIADVYDALISRRPYKEPLPHGEAVEQIRAGSGSLFDPRLVEVFLECAGEFEAIAGNIPDGDSPGDVPETARDNAPERTDLSGGQGRDGSWKAGFP
mgnify:CR=1 FL=1